MLKIFIFIALIFSNSFGIDIVMKEKFNIIDKKASSFLEMIKTEHNAHTKNTKHSQNLTRKKIESTNHRIMLLKAIQKEQIALQKAKKKLKTRKNPENIKINSLLR